MENLKLSIKVLTVWHGITTLMQTRKKNCILILGSWAVIFSVERLWTFFSLRLYGICHFGKRVTNNEWTLVTSYMSQLKKCEGTLTAFQLYMFELYKALFIFAVSLRVLHTFHTSVNYTTCKSFIIEFYNLLVAFNRVIQCTNCFDILSDNRQISSKSTHI